jgi:hypothetical protein
MISMSSHSTVRREPGGRSSRRQTSIRSLTALVILVLVLAGLAGAATKPTLKVTPSTVKQGGKVTFTGAHWPKRTKVSLLLGFPNSDAAKFATVATTTTGTFRYTLPIKPSAPKGKYVVLACRKNCQVKVQRNMTIVAGR